MIIDNIKNASKYYCLGRDFENALKFMLNCNEIVDKPVILNERVAIKPNSYTTRNETECVFEAHKLYADTLVQITSFYPICKLLKPLPLCNYFEPVTYRKTKHKRRQKDNKKHLTRKFKCSLAVLLPLPYTQEQSTTNKNGAQGTVLCT